MAEQMELPLFEEWRDIPGYEGIYQVSDQGRVRRIAKKIGATKGYVFQSRINRHGYRILDLRKDGVQTTHQVHRLVMLAFAGEPPTHKHQVNHMNGIRHDNRLVNLEYVTASENLLHSYYVLGRPRSGDGRSRSVFTEQQVREIRTLHAQGLGYKRLAKRFGASRSAVMGVCRYKTWKHIE